LELPFLHSNLEFDNTMEFAHKRRYQTEFSALSQHTLVEDAFSVSKELFLESNARTRRIRSTSLSLPQHSISNAFGPSMFASMWEPIQQDSGTNATTRPAEEVTLDTENVDTALARTIDYLGLDDPLNSPTIATPRNERPRSISFQESKQPPAPFLHSRSSTLAILEGTDFHTGVQKSPEIPSWEEMVCFSNVGRALSKSGTIPKFFTKR
jgi:hypothetical protein